MAKRAQVRLDEQKMGAFLTSAPVRGMVGSAAQRVAAKAGTGFDADTWVSPVRGTSARGNSNPPRVVGGVSATTAAARVRNARDNVLLRARDAGRV